MGETQGMDLFVQIFVTAFVFASIAALLGVFVWAARKDGEDDRALQKRLGIKRKTRIGS